MVIVCEGLDRVGKGTQIQRIKRHLEEKGSLCHVLHYSNIKGSDVEKRSKEYYRQMFDIMRYSFNRFNLILDRAHLGEFVYSPLYRNYDGSYIFDLEKNYLLHDTYNGTKLIVFIDEAENLVHREDGFSFSKDIEKKKEEIRRFDEAYDKSALNKLLININGHDENAVWEKFVKDFVTF